MSAMHNDDFDVPTTPLEVVKHAPKHAVVKAARFAPKFEAAKVAVTAPLTKDGRAARALQKASRAEEKAAVKSAKAEKELHAKAVEARRAIRAITEAKTPRIAQAPTLTVRGGFETTAAGETSPTYKTVAGGIAKGAEATADALFSTMPDSLLLQLFETTEQRSRRNSINSVANTLVLLAGIASRIAAARK